jgi:NADH dehydrogenase
MANGFQARPCWDGRRRAGPIIKLLGGQTDRAGRVSVGPFLNLQDVPGVFVVGDASSVVHNGRPVPGVVQAAIQQRDATSAG